MSSTAIANLYLKWRAFRELVGHPHSDAQIAEAIFGPNEGAVKFSKLLYGDYGCAPDVASEIVGVVNRRLDSYRKARGLQPRGEPAFRVADLGLPVYEFTRRMLAAAEATDADALERAHRALLAEMSPSVTRAEGGPRLTIERLSTGRMFETVQPSGGDGPVVFESGRHLGRLAVEGLTRDPLAVYTMFMRDPSSAGFKLWELKWGETVLWLPSPFVAKRRDGVLPLMQDAQPVKPVPGRFIVTAVMVLDRAGAAALDPRGETPPSAALDEAQTTRFMTNLRRIMKRKPEALAVATNEYVVVA